MSLFFLRKLKEAFLDNNLFNALPCLLLRMRSLQRVHRHGNHNYFKVKCLSVLFVSLRKKKIRSSYIYLFNHLQLSVYTTIYLPYYICPFIILLTSIFQDTFMFYHTDINERILEVPGTNPVNNKVRSLQVEFHLYVACGFLNNDKTKFVLQ